MHPYLLLLVILVFSFCDFEVTWEMERSAASVGSHEKEKKETQAMRFGTFTSWSLQS